MSDHTTSGSLLQELVPFALALKLILHELSMSLQRLTARAHASNYDVNNNNNNSNSGFGTAPDFFLLLLFTA
jgi:hypothetical protein